MIMVPGEWIFDARNHSMQCRNDGQETTMPRLPSLDDLITGFDVALRTLAVQPVSERPHPDAALPAQELNPVQRRHAAGLMRVNHCGEVCAQALYQGQAVVCHDPLIRTSLDRAASEEVEHLEWTAQRIRELDSRVSLLNTFWYFGAFAIGVLAGKCGDHWSLGFLAETERQVGTHLDGHLRLLPVADAKSRAIVCQMRDDEIAHAEMAVALGGRELPLPARALMRVAAKVMTHTAYHV